MTWITPKIDWTTDDYYNLEDAQRIAGNICHLKEMALDIYGAKLYTCLAYRTTYQQIRFFGISTSSIRVGDLTVHTPDEYTHGLTYWLDKDADNLRTLSYLILMSAKPEPVYVENFALDYTLNSSPSYTFTGNCIYDDSVTKYDCSDNSLTSIWYTNRNDGIIINMGEFVERAPLNYYVRDRGWNNDNGKCALTVTVTPNKLHNSVFWNDVVLNDIEIMTNCVYNRFTSYLEE